MLLLAETVREHGAGTLGPTVLAVTAVSGGVSGGSLATLWGQLDRTGAIPPPPASSPTPTR